MQSRNIFHQNSVGEGVTSSDTGFCSPQLERDRLKLYVAGEADEKNMGEGDRNLWMLGLGRENTLNSEVVDQENAQR